MKIYICGDKKDELLFDRATERIISDGNVPIDPRLICQAFPDGGVTVSDVVVVLYEVIRISDAIVLMDGWEQDFMARLEKEQARRLEREIIDWTN